MGTLTAIPVRPPATVDRRRSGIAMLLAPVAAAPLGAAVVAVAAAGHWLGLPEPAVAVLALGAGVLGNRGLHLDGLSDTLDAMASSHDRDRALAVMRSGSAGPAGAAAVVLVLLLQAAGLAALLTLPQWWRAAALAGVALCVSRAALAVCCARGVPAARADGLGNACARSVPRPAAVAVWLAAGLGLAAVCAWSGLPWWRGALAALLAAAVCVLLVARAVRRFGGVTGDVFGAGIELAFATLLLALS